METKSFYGTRRSLTSYILSPNVPDDGNISDVDGDSSKDGDAIDTQDDNEPESESGEYTEESADESADEADGSDADVDDGASASSSASATNVSTKGLLWSSVYKGVGLPLQFTDDHGPFVLLPGDARQADYFGLLFPDTLFKLICDETNRYAVQHNRLADITVPEIKAFLGLVLAMGIHRLPRIRDYWDRHWVVNVQQFTQIFTRQRFMHIWSNLHVVNNDEAVPRTDPAHDRLFKVRPIVKKLQETFCENYAPGQNISVDESMVRFKGRSTMKQYMPLKPIKRGFKVWSASCACCGYLLSFQIYSGKEGGQEKGLAHRVVTDLVADQFCHRNHIVYVDNFFTSLPLLEDLESKGILLCGTYRTNRTGFPKELQDRTLLKGMVRGDSVARHKENTTCTVWIDKRPVYVVSNAFPPDSTTVKRKNADGSTSQVSCPAVVANYNRCMGGVDLTDQLKGSYGFNRKSKKWWFRLFFHLFDLAATNSFVLYRHDYREQWHPPLRYRPQQQLQFRCQLADNLVNHFSARKQRGPAVKTPIVSLTPSGHKVADLRKIGVTRGRCEYCSVGQHRTRK